MKKLINSSTAATNLSAISVIKYTNAATILIILAASAAESAALSVGATNPVAPLIIEKSNAQAEANCLNLNYQAVIGAKEGATEEITEKFGRKITDIILRMADGNNFKGIEDYKLRKLVTAAISGAYRPATDNALEQLSDVLGYQLNYHQKVYTNMELLWAKAAFMQLYGVTVGNDQLTLVLLANIDVSNIEGWGRKYHPAIQAIRRLYNYNQVHKSTSFQIS